MYKFKSFLSFTPAVVIALLSSTDVWSQQNQIQTLKGSRKKIQQQYDSLGENGVVKINKNMNLQVQVTDKNGNLVNQNKKIKKGQTVTKKSQTRSVVIGRKEEIVGQKTTKTENYSFEPGVVKDNVNNKGYVEGSNIYAGKNKGNAIDLNSGKTQNDVIAGSQNRFKGMSKEELKNQYKNAKYKDKNGNAITTEAFNSSIARRKDLKQYDIQTGKIVKTESSQVVDVKQFVNVTKEVKEQSVAVSGGKKGKKKQGKLHGSRLHHTEFQGDRAYSSKNKPRKTPKTKVSKKSKRYH